MKLPLTVLIGVCVLAVLPIPVGAEAGQGKAEPERGLEWGGLVSETWEFPLFVDYRRRRLYTIDGTSGFVLSEFDLDAPYGNMLIRKKKLPFTNGKLTEQKAAPDLTGRRLFMADQSQAWPYQLPLSVIRVLDLDTFELTAEWDLRTHVGVPNFRVLGMTYSEEDQRLYVSGSIAEYPFVDISEFFGLPFYPLSVMAIDVATGKLAWMRPLSTQCLRPMTTGGNAYIFRSRRSDSLYLACARSDASFSAGTFPGAAGVLRLHIGPAAGQQDALLLREEFFRAPGSFSSIVGTLGQAVFDYATDRFVFASSSVSTPGAWVFDGALSAWVGFIPTYSKDNASFGLDPLTGHLMIRDGIGITVTDVRATPVPQGETFELSSPRQHFVPGLVTLFASDPLTRRFFIKAQPGGGGEGTSGTSRLLAFRDAIPLTVPERPLHYDDLTDGIAEGRDTLTTFSASAKGFGARAFLVGGAGGLTSPARPGYQGGIYRNLVGDAVSPADRGFWAARMSSMDLRNVGASASAQAIVVDDGTNDQRGAAQHDARKAGVPDAAAAALDWPWPPAFCLDAGDASGADTASGPGTSATVECDLERERTSAATSAGAFGGEDVSIAGARFEASSERKAGTGVKTESVATVHGFEVSVPGVGTLRIDDVRRQVVTRAGGRAKTAVVEDGSSIEGVEVIGASGERYACAQNCDLRTVANRVNDMLGPVMRMRVPEPEVIATDGGAFATFREPTPEYINDLVMNNDPSRAVPAVHLEIYNDWGEKSRLVIQLAAIESSAIYGISSAGSGLDPVDDPLPVPPLPVTPPIVGVAVPPSYPGAPVAAVAPPVAAVPPASIIQRVLRTALFAARSPKDAISMVLILSLFGAIGALGLRRGSLIKLLSKQHA